MRSKKKIIIGLLGALIVFGVLLAFAPTMINMGLGRGYLASKASDHFNGSVDLGKLQLSWFGPQVIENLLITDENAQPVARLDLYSEMTLASVLFGGLSSLDLDITGNINASLHPDGKISLAEIIKTDEFSKQNKPSNPQPPSLAGIEDIKITLNGLTLTIHDEGADNRIVLENLSGSFTYAPGNDTLFYLRGDTFSGQQHGTIDISTVAENLFDESGNLTLRGASLDAKIRIESIPLPLSNNGDHIELLEITLNATDLSQSLSVSVDLRASLAGETPSRLVGELHIQEPLDAAGLPHFEANSITGALEGTNVPTLLLQPFLAESGLDALRDFGPIANISAQFAHDHSNTLLVKLDTEYLDLNLNGYIDPATLAVKVEKMTFRWDIQPQLVSTLTNYRLDRPVTARADLFGITIPAHDRAGRLPLEKLAFGGTLSLDLSQPLTISRKGSENSLALLERVEVKLDTLELGKGVQVTGEALIDGGTIAFDERIIDLFDAQGRFTPGQAAPIGIMTIRNLPGDFVTALMSEPNDAVAALLGERIDATLTTQSIAGGVHYNLEFSSPHLDANMTALKLANAMQIQGGRINFLLTPELAAIAQSQSDQPILIRQPTPVTIELKPLKLPGTNWSDYQITSTTIGGKIVFDNLLLENMPPFEKAVRLNNFAADLTATLGNPNTYTLRGDMTLINPHQNTTVATLNFDVEVTPEQGTFLPEGTVQTSIASMTQLEILLGSSAKNLTTWLGERGDVGVTLSKRGQQLQATIEPDLTRLAGTFEVALSDEAISVTGVSSRFILNGAALDQRLNPATHNSDSRQLDSTMHIASDASLQLTVKKLTLPRAAFRGEAFTPNLARVDLTITGKTLELANAQGLRTSLEDINVTISTSDPSQSIAFEVQAICVKSIAADQAPDAGVNIQGTIQSLFDHQGQFVPDQAKLHMTANVSGTPTAVADAVLNMQGLLVAAVGPEMKATFELQDFSANSGTLDGRIETTNGWLEAHLFGKDGTIHDSPGQPLTAQLALTEPLRTRLLYKVAPVLADIRTVSKPIDFSIANASVPVNGDTRLLNADIEINIGEVEFDSGSITLGILKAFNASNAKTLPGYIEPIHAKITNGVVTYERFIVRIDKYNLPFSGQINLNEQYVDMRTEVPLSGLAMSIRELRNLPGDINIPLVIRGPYDNVKTEIDPDFDIGKLLIDAGIRGGLEELFRRNKGSKDIGKLLESIFGNASGGGSR